MVRNIRNKSGWEQKPKQTVTFRKQLLGIIRNVDSKGNQPRFATLTPGTAENKAIGAEQEGTKATYFLLKKTLTI